MKSFIDRIKGYSFASVMIISIAVFAFVVSVGVFYNGFQQPPMILIFITAILAAGLFFARRKLYKRTEWIKKNFYVILSVCLALLLCANIITGFILRFEPAFDLGAIYHGAIAWAKSGSFMGEANPFPDHDYFYYFPNNLGGMALLYVVFRAALVFGITDHYAVAMIFAALLTCLTVFLTVICAKKMFGDIAGIMSLLCIMIFPPFYFMAPVFYTDVLSMLFPVLMLYAFLKANESYDKRKKAVYLALAALVCAIGALIKGTVIITAIAFIIHCIFEKGFLKAAVIGIVFAGIIAITFSCFDMYMYSNHIDENRAQKMNTPYSHWIMMSLKGNGRYNHDDYVFTRSFEDTDERDAAIAQEIKDRIRQRGMLGMLELFCRKSSVDLGDGTLAQSDFLDEAKELNSLHSVLLYTGKYFFAYRCYCTGVFYAFWMFSGIAAYKAMHRRKCEISSVPILCICGIFLFLMMWEVSARYITNFVPMLILCAAYGVNGKDTAR